MILCVLLCLHSGCFKEKPYKPKTGAGNDQRVIIPMTPAYRDLFFFSLKKGQIVRQSNPEHFDLMFENTGQGKMIWLNTSKLMMVKRTGKTSFNDVTYKDTLNKDGWLIDKPDYSPDSNAIGVWWKGTEPNIESDKQVYLIQLGKDLNGNPLGYRKIQIEHYVANTYHVRFAFPDGTDEHLVSITKNGTTCYRYLSFNNGGRLIDVEPSKDEWDLVFLRYTYIFYDPYYLPYLVVGALTNPLYIQAYKDSTLQYEKITLNDVQQERFSSRRDVIGYDWKKYDFTEYKVNPLITYFIKTSDQRYYKLRFLDFYNEKFERGYPTFVYEEL
ncbi:MAG: HmuY family protein [Chitinophagales bacterium]|nr:HmuY family protein [Chitinophagales bacterium]